MPDLDFKRLLLPARADAGAFFRGDWTLNLYRGCNHGCIYCDSRSVCYHMENFDRVRAKRDCLAALETELRCKRRAGVVSMGAASDAYNALEKERQLTRGALQLLRRYGFGVMIPTKSELIARDTDVLGDLARGQYCCVAFSITTADAQLASLLEPGAPEPSRRWAAMRALADAGVTAGVWLNPMLPFLTDTEDNLREVVRRTAQAGGRFVICHFGVTLREGDREYFYAALDAHPRFAGIREQYARWFGLDYLCPSPQAEHLAECLRMECAREGLLCDFASVNREAARREPEQTSLWGTEPRGRDAP